MAPAKRKRSDRVSVDAGDNRPSPHRPANTNLGQHDRGPDMRDGGGRRSSRGNQGGGRGRRNDRDNPNKLTVSARATPTPGPMSPPAPRPSSATQTPTPTLELSNPIPGADPLPFDYAFLTDERTASWDTNGRQEVIDLGIQALQDEDTTDLASVLQEFIRATLDGRLDPNDAGNCVKDILGPETAEVEPASGTFDAHTFFLDILSMIFDAKYSPPPAQAPVNHGLRRFTAATGISPIVMRQKLDAQILQSLGLTRDTFIRVGIRQATHLLYRQANYNLLREETEGYSKLVTELFTTSGSEPPSSEVVEDAFERVKGLIGTFDLDVGRVLDITLDVFAAVLIKHFRFFIKLLRISSWWPRNGDVEGATVSRCGGLPAWALPSSPGWMSTEEDDQLSKQQRSQRDTLFWARAREVGLDAFFELGGRQIVDEESRKRIFGNKKEVNAALDADRQWIEGTGTFPPSGNRVAAQLLGFKLRFYASAARDNDDILPANLIYLTALLIKIGFISLRDLYPHLWPLDEDMPAVRETKRKELEEKERLNRPGGATNALMMAGALADDTLPNGGRTREAITTKPDATPKVALDAEDKDKLDDPMDQKVQLLTCLLTIGAIPESLFILGRFPWLPEAYPELLELINRILNHSIKDVYDMSRPTATVTPECSTKKVADLDQNGVHKGQVRLAHIPVRKQLRWPFPDKFDTNENNSYRFYWDEWADNVPVCQSVDDIFTLCGTLLNYSGVGIGKDATLLSKLARIGAKSLAEDPSQRNLKRWQDLLKRLLVPALSLTKSNTSVVNEIYDMLRFYPVFVRYSIYAEWFEGQISRLPAMKTAFARTTTETQSIMKRISMTNLTTMARSLAKAAYASPGIVYRVALGQIEAYTNLTEVVVECAKYFTDLGYDVLVWSLMSSLGGKDRNRNNSEFALLPSRWLLALSKFSGRVFKRYSIMNLAPIIQYVNDQLYRGNSTDLVILKELIAQMAGIVPNTDFNDAQIAAMTGGEVLRRQTLISLQDKRYESLKTSKRLMRALTDTRLAGELLVAIAQHRQAAIYAIPDNDAHIKLLATMIDDTQLILDQYLDLLRSNLSVDEFDRHVPGISELLIDFGLQPALAFMMGRTSVLRQMAGVETPFLNGATKALPTFDAPVFKAIDGDGDIAMDSQNEQNKPNEDETAHSQLVDGDTKDDVQMNDLVEGSPSAAADVTNQSVDTYKGVLEPIMSTVQVLYPEDSWKALTPEFYATFWVTTLSEIVLPSTSYETEIRRLLNQQTEVMRDRTDTSRPAMIRKEDAKKALNDTKVVVTAEYHKLMNSFKETRARLLKRKAFWFNHTTKADALSDEILEKCLIPRLLLSPTDAEFCFKMIKFLHDNGTPHFRTLSLYARLFRSHRLRSIIFTCTVREAENLGRFLRLALADLARWHADSVAYEKEAWGPNKTLTGFAKALDTDGKPKGFLDHDGKNGFRNILLNWHKNLNSALRECLEGTEWMHIRNAITILKSVAEVFPVIDFMGNSFVKQLEVIAKREKDVREDLSLTGNAVLVQLKKRSKSWVMVQAFGFSMVAPGQQNGSPASSSSRQATSTPKTTLKPTAPEFKPQSRASSIGISTPKANTTADVEDGEVDDAKTSTTTAPTAKLTAGPNSVPETGPADPNAPTTTEPRKSEILIRREQIQRENAAKAANPQSSLSSVPMRSEASRNSISNTLGAGDRGNHSLPSRPDAPFPSRQDLDRLPRHGDRRDGRDSRLPESIRLGRPGDRPGDRPRDFSGSDRRGTDSNPRDFGRPSDRIPGHDRERIRLEPPRWTPDSARENLERSTGSNRGSDTTGRLSRETAMPPPRSSAPSSERAPPVSSERLPPVNPERQELINPERAALISNGKSSPRSDSPRRGREDLRDRVSSRPQSPRRHGIDKVQPESRHDDRPSRNGHNDLYNSSRGSVDDSQAPPAGPRSDRHSDHPTERIGNERPPFQPTPSQPRLTDPEHGRLNATPRQPPDPNFGRLNPAPASDIPSGPRDRNARGNRMPITGPPRRDGRPELPRPPTPEKQPPTGPSSDRHPRRSASGQFDTTSAPGTAPNTQAAALPAIGVHPDRAKHLGPQVQSQPPPPPPNATPLASMHPDRARYANENNLPVNQIMSNRSWQQIPPLATAVPPSGPKASQPSPIVPGTNGISAPTGPASATERAQRGVGGRRQLSNINTMLQNSSSDRIQVRGRGRVSTGGMADTPISGPSTPAPTPPPPPPPPGPAPSRPEFAREPPRDLINPERAELITGNPPGSDDKDRDRGRRERSGRHSRRSSRSVGRERESKRGPSEDERSSRGDHRDRRVGERGEFERDRHIGRSSPHGDLMAGRETRGGTRDSGRERDRERSDREPGRGGRDGRERESRDPHEVNWNSGERGEQRTSERGEPRGSERGGGGRSRDIRGDPRGEERRDGRGTREEGGRKRHSEERGLDSRGREKRARTGGR